MQWVNCGIHLSICKYLYLHRKYLIFQWTKDFLEVSLYSKPTFPKRGTIIFLYILKQNVFFYKNKIVSSKNVLQTVDLIDLINTRLVKIIWYQLSRSFCVLFYILRNHFICYYQVLWMCHIVFCLWIVQDGLTISFIFDAGQLNQ